MPEARPTGPGLAGVALSSKLIARAIEQQLPAGASVQIDRLTVALDGEGGVNPARRSAAIGARVGDRLAELAATRRQSSPLRGPS